MAAEQGDAMAQCNLGQLYEFGNGVIQSYEQSFILYKKAALAGDPRSQYLLSLLWKEGNGTGKNDIQAKKMVYIVCRKWFCGRPVSIGPNV